MPLGDSEINLQSGLRVFTDGLGFRVFTFGLNTWRRPSKPLGFEFGAWKVGVFLAQGRVGRQHGRLVGVCIHDLDLGKVRFRVQGVPGDC